MMDSQDNVLKQDITEEAVAAQPANVDNDTVAEAGNAPATTAVDSEPDTEAAPLKMYASKHEVLERVKELAHSDETPAKDEVDHLKTAFYKLLFAEREADQKTFIENGGDPEAYVMKTDDSEEQFKAEMGLIKEKRAKAFQQQEEEKKANLQRKQQIIEKIKMMSTSPEEANKSYNDFKALQQEWKDIKAVPAEKANELWRNYQLYVEQYYDLLNLNRELREYDFKKNLEQKTLLCEAAEKLADEPDAVSAFHQLQELHQQYREIGPVAKELREQIWARFKAASTVINKRHQQHFEELRAKEEENLTRKTALCEKVEAIAKEENKNATDWENHTKQIIDIQTEWKTIGMVPKKVGDQLWAEFVAACNKFFEARNAATAGTRNEEQQNLDRKKEIIAKLKELLDSTADNVQATLQQLIDEYGKIGHVPFKEKDKLFKEYHKVVDALYKQLNISASKQRLDNFKSSIKSMAKQGEDMLDNERGRLMRRYEQLKSEITTYENNLGFLNASSKKGNSLIDEMNRKVNKLKDDLELIRQKIKAIDAENK